jgi:hypothetical protein
MISKDDWQEWSKSRKVKSFINLIIERRSNYLEKFMTFSDQLTLSKDYFYHKGFCDGMLEIVDFIEELKGV